MDRSTFYKWKKEPEFQAALHQLQRDQDEEFSLLRRAMAQAAGETVMTPRTPHDCYWVS